MRRDVLRDGILRGFVWFCEGVAESGEKLSFSGVQQLMLGVDEGYKFVEDGCIVEVIG